jgi:protein involved in temperature-dependent protein secretion
LANAAVAILAAAQGQSDDVQPKWSLRHTAAQLYAAAGDWKRALPQAELAWQPSADAPVGAFLVRAYVHNGMLAKAQRTFAEVAKRIKRGDPKDRQGFMELKAFLDRAVADTDKTTQKN